MSLGQFLFPKNQMIGRRHRMSHWSSWDSSRRSVCTLGQFGLLFSCQLAWPSNASILSHNHNFLNFCWSATISLTFWDSCNSNSLTAVSSGSLNEIVDDVVRCLLSLEVLFSMRSTTISGSVEFLSLCW